MIITLLRKPLEGSITENTLKHGCGAINIDANRIRTDDNLKRNNPIRDGSCDIFIMRSVPKLGHPNGRWPANFALVDKDEIEGCPVKEIDKQNPHVSRFFKQFKKEDDK